MAPEIAVRENGIVRVVRSLRDAILSVDERPAARQILVDDKEVHPSADVRRICGVV